VHIEAAGEGVVGIEAKGSAGSAVADHRVVIGPNDQARRRGCGSVSFDLCFDEAFCLFEFEAFDAL
jgi:hypothetical protein